mmetsp:Transcript_39055/g.72737  ORF Transcript_39055/g.72737 Transcript_39055/m.72737 type:complete len:250 (-) Transcript_39055:174-923(-)
MLANGVRARSTACIHIGESFDVGLNNSYFSLVPTWKQSHKPSFCSFDACCLCIPFHTQSHGGRRLLAHCKILDNILSNLPTFQADGAGVWPLPERMSPGHPECGHVTHAHNFRYGACISLRVADHATARQSRRCLCDHGSNRTCSLYSHLQALSLVSAIRQKSSGHYSPAQSNRSHWGAAVHAGHFLDQVFCRDRSDRHIAAQVPDQAVALLLRVTRATDDLHAGLLTPPGLRPAKSCPQHQSPCNHAM